MEIFSIKISFSLREANKLLSKILIFDKNLLASPRENEILIEKISMRT